MYIYIMDYKQFLLKHSTIDGEFLNDFYEIIREDYIDRQDEFLIDSELVRKVLCIKNKKSFEDNIKQKYDININYKLTKQTSKHNNSEIITLTPKVAKLICLTTKSKFGAEVRKYFIDVEFILYKYKNYIIEGLKEQIKQLENNQK